MCINILHDASPHCLSIRLVLPGYSSGTPGYLLSLAGAQKLLATEYQQQIIPLDEFMPALYSYHPRRDLRERFQAEQGQKDRAHFLLQAYAARDDIVTPVDHDDSDTKRSNYHGSKVHPALAAWLQGEQTSVKM